MRNKFPGKCYRCGTWVEKGAGHFERYMGSWRTQHAACAIKARDEKYREQMAQIASANGSVGTVKLDE